MLRLFSYYRSSAAYRVRIALNLKGLPYEQQAVNLLMAEEQQESYQRVNPQKMVPVLEFDGILFFQSMAILEFLDESYADNSILPDSNTDRAFVRALSNIIACDIHPLNNLRVLKYLTDELNADVDAKATWYRYWIEQGFEAFESHLKDSSNGSFCFADKPGMADILLIPQVYNAKRFKVDMSQYPLIESINANCLTLPAFIEAMPENQPDAH